MDALWYLMLHIFGFILEYLSILGIGLGRAALFLPTCQHTLDSAMNTPNQRIRAREEFCGMLHTFFTHCETGWKLLA